MQIWIVAVLALIGITSQRAWSQVAACPTCTANFALSRDQVRCVSQRIDALLARKLDPVFFDASSCARAASTMSAPTVPLPNPVPTNEANALWLQLTKRQLGCLKPKLAQVLEQSDQSIVLALDDANCPTKAP